MTLTLYAVTQFLHRKLQLMMLYYKTNGPAVQKV